MNEKRSRDEVSPSKTQNGNHASKKKKIQPLALEEEDMDTGALIVRRNDQQLQIVTVPKKPLSKEELYAKLASKSCFL